VIEVCAGSIADVAAAKEAGADRVELNSALPLGGLTPSAAAIRQAIEIFPGRIITMSRPKPGGFCYSCDDWLTLIRDAEFALAEGAAGIAFGVLSPGREVDAARVAEFAKLFGKSEIVFHRAFDLTSDWRNALKTLVDTGITRVMTSGQKSTAIEGLATIAEIVHAAANKIEILVAGGVHPDNARRIVDQTGASQLHGTFSQLVPEPDYDSAPIRFAPNDRLRTADANIIRQTLAAFKGNHTADER
jgi:copper homeostasis protein